jgi:hypothetical protein
MIPLALMLYKALLLLSNRVFSFYIYLYSVVWKHDRNPQTSYTLHFLNPIVRNSNQGY